MLQLGATHPSLTVQVLWGCGFNEWFWLITRFSMVC